jgi:hypothetical protein
MADDGTRPQASSENAVGDDIEKVVLGDGVVVPNMVMTPEL